MTSYKTCHSSLLAANVTQLSLGLVDNRIVHVQELPSHMSPIRDINRLQMGLCVVE